MKKNYMNTRKRSRLLTLALVAAFGLLSFTAFGQTALSWNGSTDTDATNPLNWTPNMSAVGNDLMVDSAYKFTNQPVLTLTGSNTIDMINVNNTGIFTIADAGDFLDINQNGSMYFHGGLVLQAGNMSIRKNLYLEDSITKIEIEGGSLEVRSTMCMAHGNDSPIGGRIEISGDGVFKTRSFPIRFATDSLQSIILITEDGQVQMSGGDYTSSADFYIARKQILSDDSFDPFSYFDVDNNLTIIDLRSKDELFLMNDGTVQVLVDEEIPPIMVAHNRGFESLVTQEWKYAETSGGALMSFVPAQTGDSLYQASFSAAGSYFVVLTGNDGSTDLVSDEVQVAVTSPMVILDPLAEQTIRVGWTGGMITATFLETPTSYEWKYTTTSGSGYVSFAPAITVAEYIPDFDAEGINYVVCEAIVGGETFLSPEVNIKMVAADAGAQNITWTGAFSNDAADNRNWDPMMHPWFNTASIPSRDWIATPPTVSTAGNDTINSVWCYDSSSFVVNKPEFDTLVIRGSSVWQNGFIVLESGIVVYNNGYIRLDHQNSGIIVKGNSQFLHDWEGGFIIGHGDGVDPGGQVVIQDNGYMKVHHIWRWANDTTMSVITISDNGILELADDQLSEIANRVARNQIRALEGFNIEYDLKVVGDDTSTVVTAKSIVAFDITPLSAQYCGIDLPSGELSMVNDDDITSQEWKYTTTSGSGYMAFDPAETGATLTASFDAAGAYFVICEGSDGTDTYVSDEATINVVSVEITPATAQALVEFEEGAQLSVTESIAADSREWKSSTTSGSGYASFSPARLSDSYRPFFAAAGTYYIVCESVFGGKGIVSNEVEVVVTEEVGVEINESLSLRVYPNPSKGSFYLDVENGSSYTVEVFDITGKLVFNKAYINVNGPQDINITNKGLHLLKVIQEDKVMLEKVVIR